MLTFNVNAAAQRAWEFCGQESYNNSSRKAGVDAKMRAGTDIHYCYKGQCVGVLRRVWAAAGINIPGMDRCGNPSAYMNLLNSHPEFYKRVGTDIICNPRYGDVCLYHGGTSVGHGVIYLPIKGQGRWVSDCVQKSWLCYSKYWDLECFRFNGSVNGDGGNVNFSAAPGGGGGGGGGGQMVMSGGTGDMPRWQKAVLDMKSWYETNIHDYNQQGWTECPLINQKVRHDCSGYVTSCLKLYGMEWPHNTMVEGNWDCSHTNDSWTRLTQGGFTAIECGSIEKTKEQAQAFDIFIGHGHTEVYAGDGKSYSWGSCHDLAKGGMPSGINWHCGNGNPYSVIWRCNGTGGSWSVGCGGGGPSATPENIVAKLNENCPNEIKLKGLWGRYHCHMGPHSYAIGPLFFGGGGGGMMSGGSFTGTGDFNNVAAEIMQYIQDAINGGMAPNSQAWSFDKYRDNVMSFLSGMTAYGLSPFAAVCLAGAAATEAGFSGNFKAEPTELASKGWAYAGEGIFGFTSWGTKQKLIQKAGVNLPTSESAYVAGPHITDLSWQDHVKLGAVYASDSKYAQYFKPGANPSDTLCAAFLFKAGNWLNSGNLFNDVKDAVGRYKSTHARYGYKIRDGFAEMSNIAMKIAQATS